jgi:asparagine synthase (glutamine-hydrolysing)
MCGIFYSSEVPDPFDERRIGHSISHRGPDSLNSKIVDEGFMMHSRLSIIDLSLGDQPMQNENNSVVIIYNGEIYNFRELRTELTKLGMQFRTYSDTEVILHGYQAWGIELLCRKLDGMFAFVLQDKRTKLIYAAVDKFGEKPLFFRSTAGTLQISSCLSSLKSKNQEGHFEPLALASYLIMGFNAFSKSVLQGIQKLPPSSYTIWESESSKFLTQKYYWNLGEMRNSDNASDKKSIEEILDESVVSRLISDVPVGLALSGGVDSSILASFASKYINDLQTFSIAFPDNREFDESQQSKRVATQLGLPNISIKCGTSDFYEEFFKWNRFTDEPILDPAVIPLSLLAKVASETVKVLLSGEGADEIFGGYSYYFSNSSPIEKLINSREDASLGFINFKKNILESGFPLTSNPEIVFKLLGISPKSFFTSIEELSDAKVMRKSDEVKDRQVSDILNWLPNNLLIKLDRALMAHGLEGRAPFLSPDLVINALNLIKSEKFDGEQTKIALREIGHKYLGNTVQKYPKVGLIPPYVKFLDSIGKEGEEVFQSSFTKYGSSTKDTLEFLRSSTNPRFQYNSIALAYWMDRKS